MKFILGALFLCVAVASAHEGLEGAKVFNVWPATKKQHIIVGGLEESIPGIDMWQKAHIAGREARILVPAHQLTMFELAMNSNNIYYELIMDDPQSVLDAEMRENEIARMRSNMLEGKIEWTYFMRHQEINNYLDDLARRFPNRVTVQTVGRTVQNRDIKVIKISSNGGNDPNKPVIVVDAGIHAREWIAPPVALYMIHKLTENITENDVANNIDWVIFPLLNPDGYEYSHTSTRLWRKTRSTVTSTSCPGIDGNRNFAYKWMESGSSSNPCSDNFAGPTPFSEIETRVLRDEVLRYGNRVKVYMAIHSHGSYFLYPYGYDGSDAPNVNELHSLGTRVGQTIDNNKAPGARNYLVGNSANALNYKAAGASDDWAMGTGGVSLAYTLELPSGGANGFDPPPTRILQTVTETWPGLLVLARYIL